MVTTSNEDPAAPVTVLVDFSPLDTPSRLRGIGRYVLGLAAGLRELHTRGELELDVQGIAQFDWRGQHARPTDLAYSGTPVHPNGYRWYPYRWRKRLGLARAAANLGAALLHVTEPTAMPRPQRGMPIVVTCHDLIPLVLHRDYLGKIPGQRLMRYWKDSRIYRQAQRILAISASTRADLVNHLGLDPERIDVAPLGIEHERFCATPSHADERERLQQKYRLERPFLLYLGAFDVRKNVPLLVRAFAQARLANDFDLVLGGALEDAYRVPLLELIQSLGLEERVRLLGFVDDADLAPLYRACHLHVFPSRYEGFGLPVAEALACGAPTLCNASSSLPEVAGDAAMLLEMDNTDVLSAALRTLSYDDPKRAQLSEAGPKRAARFNWRACAKLTVESYQRALR